MQLSRFDREQKAWSGGRGASIDPNADIPVVNTRYCAAVRDFDGA